ncbi:homeobox protein NANOG isoform X2 [Manis javanica]|uniref:homeobox protein NANOG isoform X2 n=1 Tax=Manis javanica TaxID=9974 RepID=UPI003C6DB612
MSVDPAPPQGLPCPEASNSGDRSPVPETYEPEENYASLQMSSAETPHVEMVSPLPFSVDLLVQHSPDSSTSPRVEFLPTPVEKSPVSKEDKVQVKKQKIRTVFSQTQLCVLNDRFQRQKYLSLQQMQELSNILNLSYKQVKTWFQNQRMKCKRWQKNNWPRNSDGMAQGYLVNASGNLAMWSNQTWNNPTWSNHSWNSQTWCPQGWNGQAWSNQAWNNQYHSFEESLQPQIQFQQNSVSDLEATLETAGESHNVIQQTTKYFSTQQIIDVFPNYSMNLQPEDV